uniref:Uncharacterized protein n=1 Tax=Arundo donax TaxID=35708 RepID=A0A0A9FP10_ARUDO
MTCKHKLCLPINLSMYGQKNSQRTSATMRVKNTSEERFYFSSLSLLGPTKSSYFPHLLKPRKDIFFKKVGKGKYGTSRQQTSFAH